MSYPTFAGITPFITFATTPAAFGDKDLESTPAPYSLHHSEIIMNIAITAALGLTQALIPTNLDSQRLFSDNVSSIDKSIHDEWYTKSDNFLDGGGGSFYTPLVFAVIMTGLN